MSGVVQKYGGSSVANAERILNVAGRVARRQATGEAMVVVVSAMGDTTDELIALAKQVTARPADREMDLLLSTGEIISCTLLAMALRERGVPARSFTGAQAGILADAGINIELITTSEIRITCIIDQGRVEDAVRALHTAFRLDEG